MSKHIRDTGKEFYMERLKLEMIRRDRVIEERFKRHIKAYRERKANEK
jgi:hypothetical protein